MISLSLEDIVFLLSGLLGLGLAVVIVVFGDQLGETLDRLHVGVATAGAPVAGLLAGFLALFGLGGLVAVRIPGVHGGFAVLAGMIAGVIGVVGAWALIGAARRADSPGAPSMRDLVGRPASVAVAISAGRFGSVYVRAEGRTHEYSATASADIATGARVTVTGAVGNGLVVALIESPTAPRVLTEEDEPDA